MADGLPILYGQCRIEDGRIPDWNGRCVGFLLYDYCADECAEPKPPAPATEVCQEKCCG